MKPILTRNRAPYYWRITSRYTQMAIGYWWMTSRYTQMAIGYWWMTSRYTQIAIGYWWMTARIIAFLGIFFLHRSAAAQQVSDFVLTKTITGDLADFTVDNLGNIYVLSQDNQLKKLSPNGDSLAVFNDVRRYGKIWSIDATNPLKLLVYYREFTMIIELDRFLNMINTIDLRKLDILQAKAVSLAYDNNVWVYDELDAKLKRIGDDGSLIDQTTDFRQLFDSTPDPAVIRDQGGLVYLYDPAKGVYAFDHYGGLKTHIALPGWQDFNVIDKSILGRDDGRFFKYQLGTLDMQETAIPPTYQGAIRITITPISIYVLKKTGLEIYTRPG